MRNLSDGEREVMAEADDDAYEAEMAGRFASDEAERDLVHSIWDEMVANDMSAGWTRVDDDDDEHPW